MVCLALIHFMYIQAYFKPYERKYFSFRQILSNENIWSFLPVIKYHDFLYNSSSICITSIAYYAVNMYVIL